MRQVICLTKCARIGYWGLFLFLMIGCTDWDITEGIQAFRVRRAVNTFFGEVVLGGPSKNYDLRTHIPKEWERVCIDFLPYAPQTFVEEKFAGKIRGEYQIVCDTNFMLLGINANNEITQVVLDKDVSRFLGNSFRGCDPGCVNCVPREKAVLRSITRNGTSFLELGGPREAVLQP
ncbi:MAG: hypothetical protein ACOYXY_00800 [Thermodesulfobacteriota bacterium]